MRSMGGSISGVPGETGKSSQVLVRMKGGGGALRRGGSIFGIRISGNKRRFS